MSPVVLGRMYGEKACLLLYGGEGMSPTVLGRRHVSCSPGENACLLLSWGEGMSVLRKITLSAPTAQYINIIIL